MSPKCWIFTLWIVCVLLLVAVAVYRGRKAKRRSNAEALRHKAEWRNARIHGVIVARKEAASRNCK